MNLRITLALALGLAGCAAPESQGGAAFASAPYATITSDAGLVTFEVRTGPAQPPSRGVVRLEYTVVRGAEDGLDLDVEPWMPAMGHGATVEPTVEAEGEGRYVVSGVQLFMPGEWEISTSISGAVNDHATVVLQIP